MGKLRWDSPLDRRAARDKESRCAPAPASISLAAPGRKPPAQDGRRGRSFTVSPNGERDDYLQEHFLIDRMLHPIGKGSACVDAGSA